MSNKKKYIINSFDFFSGVAMDTDMTVEKQTEEIISK